MKCSDNLEYTEAFESKFKNIDCLPEYVSAPTKSICQDGGKLIRRYDIDSIPYSYSRFNHLTEFLSSDRHIVDFGLCVRFLYTTKGICIEKSTDGPMSLTSLSPRISLDFLGENSKLTKQKMRLRIKSKTNSGIECYFYQFSKILKNGSYFTGNAYYSCGNIENVKLNGF